MSTEYKLVFEASGTVGKGTGPDPETLNKESE